MHIMVPLGRPRRAPLHATVTCALQTMKNVLLYRQARRRPPFDPPGIFAGAQRSEQTRQARVEMRRLPLRLKLLIKVQLVIGQQFGMEDFDQVCQHDVGIG